MFSGTAIRNSPSFRAYIYIFIFMSFAHASGFVKASRDGDRRSLGDYSMEYGGPRRGITVFERQIMLKDRSSS